MEYTEQKAGAASATVSTIPVVLTAPQVCELLCISRRTLTQYQFANILRPIRVGKKGRGVRFTGAEIARFIQSLEAAE